MTNITNIKTVVLSLTLSFLFIAISFTNISAQTQVKFNKENITQKIHVGYVSEVFDQPERAFYAAYNPNYFLNNYFSIEGQVGASHAQFLTNSGFFGRDAGTVTTANALVGLRAYIVPTKYAFRFYFNMMTGLKVQRDTYRDFKEFRFDHNSMSPTIALGLHLEFKKITAGLAVEHDLIVLKAGYTI